MSNKKQMKNAEEKHDERGGLYYDHRTTYDHKITYENQPVDPFETSPATKDLPSHHVDMTNKSNWSDPFDIVNNIKVKNEGRTRPGPIQGGLQGELYYGDVLKRGLQGELFCGSARVTPVTKEKVNHPQHYNAGKIEVIDAICDWELDFIEGNVVKYVTRAKHKEDELGDLKKARWYLDYLIKQLEQSAI